MTKKQTMARVILQQAKELGITLKTNGNWINATPTNKVPAQMLIEMAQCSNELGVLIRNQN